MSYAYYRWFPGDYMRDTMHLGWFEDLAYRRLIDLYLLHGKVIRNDRAYIMRAIRAAEPEQQAAVDTVLAEFFVLKSDGWHQKRCDAELRWRTKQSEDGKKGAEARWNKNNGLDAPALGSDKGSNANQNQNQNQITPKVKNTCASHEARFSAFWAIYPKKRSKKDAEKAWKQLNPDEELTKLIMLGLKRSIESADWREESGRFIPFPASWIRAGGWDDDFKTATKQPERKFANPW